MITTHNTIEWPSSLLDALRRFADGNHLSVDAAVVFLVGESLASGEAQRRARTPALATVAYVYAGFRFNLAVNADGRCVDAVACGGQHWTASKDEHRRNAIAQFNEERGGT